MSNQRLKSKRAVITGGGSGIGREIAKRLAADGAEVGIFEINSDNATETIEEIKQAGGLAQAIECDIADNGAVKEAVYQFTKDNPTIDILINNAGIAHIGNVESTSAEDLDKIYNVNVKGVYNGMNTVVPIMVAQGGGAIVNLASVASKIGITDRFAYSMSKGAVLTMTLSVARDYIEKNIRCNCVCPGRVHTPFVDQYLDKHYPDNREEMFEKLSKWQPIGRMGKPSEIASLVSYLVSDEASFITGSAYDVDGGTTLLR
ncbi:MAG: short-chain dehydrogenase [Verrucomicrobia bacterium]|nr:short-chain dehydrogenase [Verrucomicrobiota bacterium]